MSRAFITRKREQLTNTRICFKHERLPLMIRYAGYCSPRDIRLQTRLFTLASREGEFPGMFPILMNYEERIRTARNLSLMQLTAVRTRNFQVLSCLRSRRTQASRYSMNETWLWPMLAWFYSEIDSTELFGIFCARAFAGDHSPAVLLFLYHESVVATNRTILAWICIRQRCVCPTRLSAPVYSPVSFIWTRFWTLFAASVHKNVKRYDCELGNYLESVLLLISFRATRIARIKRIYTFTCTS